MAYHEDLGELLTETSQWADMRHEQNASAGSTLQRLRRELKRARSELKKAAPSPLVQRNEPDGLSAIRSLRPKGRRRLWDSLQTRGLRNRLKGAWLGRAAGCILGAPVEQWSIARMERLALRHGMPFPPTDYWSHHPSPEAVRYLVSPVRHFLRGHMRSIPADDDLAYTLLGLLILEKYCPGVTTEHVADMWIRHLPLAYTAERVTLENLKAGISWRKAGALNNPFQEWIGADIRSDPWGYAAPGWPEKAAELAYRDAFLSHRRSGVYGAMFFAAAIAGAFAVGCPIEALRIGLTEIPAKSRLAKDIRWALRVSPDLTGWQDARDRVDRRFKGMSAVHTNNNACLTTFGLTLGQRDFTRTIGITVAMGLDNDCTAATAGSILGAVIGASALPGQWWKPFRNRTETYLTGHGTWKNSDIVNRFLGVATTVWESE